MEIGTKSAERKRLMSVAEAMTVALQFGMFIISFLGFILVLITAMNKDKK
ncbi:putative holin-like toxin [Listeria cornellensis]|nr:putative holin-like toxin [Listeria cornellensis]